jgi:putative protease
MQSKMELLAPGGDIESVKAAIAAGADAIYLGLNVFNARYRATNLEFDELEEVVNLAHKNRCAIFITINILIIESEFRALMTLLNRLVNTRIDGVIVQDLGLFYLLAKHFKTINIHASTQLTTHNAGQIKFLSRLTATRANLSRELNIKEIKELTRVGHEHNVLSEVFIHGSNCLSFSGGCYISSVLEGKSGNRGRCSQPCRDQYLPTPAGKNFPLNLKDNSAFNNFAELYDAGVDSLKIEGRIKKFHYVYTVVKSWRSLLDNFYLHGRSSRDDTDLYRVFNRDFSNAFLKSDINKEMFIDNPRDNSARHFSEIQWGESNAGLQKTKTELYDLRTGIMTHAREKISELDTGKIAINITVSGRSGTPLELKVTSFDPSFTPFSLRSEMRLIAAKNTPIHHGNTTKEPPGVLYKSLFEKLETIETAAHALTELNLDNLQAALFIPQKEINSLQKQLRFVLNGSRKLIPPIELPRLKSSNNQKIKPRLCVLISSPQQIDLCRQTEADLFFKLPNCFSDDYSAWIDLFKENRRLTPWFPSVLIGNDFTVAVDILQQIQPKRIVTDNSGIAFEACQRGIDWIAGPGLNSINSYTLLSLKENFNCRGAFLSNELSRNQLKKIVAPDDFNLYYSIYHPILLMTCRHCLHYQVEGCHKTRVDEECRLNCNRQSAITNMKDETLFIDKSQGCYQRIYNVHNFLNTDIMTDLPDRFSGFLVDLSEVNTATKFTQEPGNIVTLFAKLLDGNPEAKHELKGSIVPTTNRQYKSGI